MKVLIIGSGGREHTLAWKVSQNSKVAKIYQIKDLLVKILENHSEREALVGKICVTENVTDYFEYLMEMSSRNLANVLIEGLPARINTLTAYLKDDYYALLPLYNFYFTRDFCYYS